MTEEKEVKEGNNSKKWFVIAGILLIFLLAGIYLFLNYFYPEVIPGTTFIESDFKKNISILLVGLDDVESVKKGEIEANSIYVAKLDGIKKEITLLAVPPDEKVNNKALKNFSLADIQNIIEENKNIKIDYFFAMSYNGFKKVVDELSGIEVELDKPLKVPEMGLLLKKGKNLLSGKEALNFVRYHNHKNNGNGRLKRQQKVITGIYNKVKQANILLDIPKLYTTVIESSKSVQTNLDTKFVKNIIDFLKSHKDMNIEYKIINF